MELRSNLEGSKTDTNRLAERPPGTSAGRTARNSERKRERESFGMLWACQCAAETRCCKERVVGHLAFFFDLSAI